MSSLTVLSNQDLCVVLQQVYTDLTLSCEGHFYPAHRLVVASSSEYLSKTLQVIPAFCPYPVVLLDGLSHHTLEILLAFMYDGLVSYINPLCPTFVLLFHKNNSV